MPQVAPLTLAICLYLIIHLTLTRTGETGETKTGKLCITDLFAKLNNPIAA